LRNYFVEYGTITSAVAMRDGDGNSKCFGFINFANADDAANCFKSLNGKKIDGKDWYVGKPQKKKFERESELRRPLEKQQGTNLYVKDLDESIDDDKLREMFNGYVSITSCKVMKDYHGHSKDSGFVAFSSPDEASRALAEMNRRFFRRKPLYVAFAECKEERRARLLANFSHQLQNPVGVSPVVPMYPPRPNQQIFHGQGQPALIPRQQQQLPLPPSRIGIYRYPPGWNE